MGCSVSLEKSFVREPPRLESCPTKTKTSVATEEGSKKPKQNGENGSEIPQNVDQSNKIYNTSKIEADELDCEEKIPSNCLTILHFNDVYNIEPRDKEPVGGAARFAHKLASFKHLNPFTVFSGDALNPSMMSSVTKGKHMIPVLNSFDINVAVYGNHDFDFGVDDLIEVKDKTNFPWLMSNVIDKATQGQLAEGQITRMFEWNGKKIGCIGLVEEEWLATLATVDPSEVIFQDYVELGTKLSKQLRDEGADLVIALTHMRLHNDTRLAELSSGIDLILGGHDHHYEVKDVNGVKIIKSGSDFRELSKININFSDDNNFDIEVEKIEITSDVPEHPELKTIVDQYMDIMKESMEETLGQIEVELDGTFASLRTKETNLGNFIVDIMRNVTKVDVVLLNSGTLRSDAIHLPGAFKKKDLVAILPMPDSVVVLELTGEQLLKALENGVSQWPKHEGRFPQISGMKFAFDPELQPGSRVVKDRVIIDEEKLDLKRLYKLCTKAYIAKGKDGYDVFAEAKILLNDEDGPILPTIVQNHFDAINIIKGVKSCRSKHRQSIVMRHSGDSPASLLDAEKHHVKVNPKVEGRIINIRDKTTELQETPQDQETMKGSNELDDDEEKEVVTKVISGGIVTAANDFEDENNTSENTRHDKASDVVSTQVIAGDVNNTTSETSNEANTNEKTQLDKPSADLHKECQPDLATEDDYWDLWEAVKLDDIDVVKKLHEEKHIRLTRLQDNKTILHLAAERNASKVVEYLLTKGQVNPNVQDEILHGVPLHGAAEYGSVDAARTLIEHGANMDQQDLVGNTALHIACINDQINFKNFLLERGANTTVVNSDGEQPQLIKE